MKINKEFINLLLEKREIYVSLLLGNEGLNYFVEKRVNNKLYPTEYNQDSLEPIEDIIYTVDFLIKEKLVEKNGQYSPTMPSFGKLSATDFDRCKYVKEKLKEFYGLMLKVRSELFDYRKRGYRTEKQGQEKRVFLLTILNMVGYGIIVICPKIWEILKQILNRIH